MKIAPRSSTSSCFATRVCDFNHRFAIFDLEIATNPARIDYQLSPNSSRSDEFVRNRKAEP
ncbi:hypothetical protein TRIP_E350037 [uncultured Spirochaetota bacterium]|jgi:hypothetical protein|uniref:Uncharacterized protein n=1 Tax=uncultured Spirochaetota bacterium TaxID=460511 RepID=A0A652ZY72_9SPIR|nr:hypothetical protein TRIP_E350037 [uncultured Spirochaetota bacterium]